MIGGMALISVLIVLSGLRGYADLVRNWRVTFDRDYTEADRSRINFASFYLLVPISVALHELGHAVFIWLFGGKVVDFGFYFFAGWVMPDRRFPPVQETLVSVAGPATNVVLSAICLLAVLIPKPPMRYAFNDLLLDFAGVSIINALIIYPLLDYGVGMNGDFSQMYSSGPRALTMTILACHIGILAGIGLMLKMPAYQREIARRTGRAPAPPGSRGVPGSGREPQSFTVSAAARVAEERLEEAISRVASGWPHPLRVGVQRHQTGLSAMISWTDGARPRALTLQLDAAGAIALFGTLQGYDRVIPIRSWSATPSTDEIVFGLREGMEHVARYSGPDFP